LIVANWKMHGSLAENAILLDAVRGGAGTLRSAGVAVCVPFPYLGQAQQHLAGSRTAWGAQNVSAYPKGPYTGEVSAAMLKEFGCTYVIVGHSERRTLYGEDDAAVAAKFGAAVDAGLIPILCIGETLSEREAGATERVVERQLGAVMSRFGAGKLSRAVLAYEPVWAIGTGRTATPEQAQAVHALLRERVMAENAQTGLSLRILYGGSVKGDNAGSLFAMSDVDGGLVGGASLDGAEFLSICAAAERIASEVT
jgi:triosephosphate isomerase